MTTASDSIPRRARGRSWANRSCGVLTTLLCAHCGGTHGGLGASSSTPGGTGGTASTASTASNSTASVGTTRSVTSATSGTAAGTHSTSSVDASTTVASAPGVRWVGRVDTSTPGTGKFAWSASGFVATVSGSKISVSLQNEGYDAFFQPVIDGQVGGRFQVAMGAAQTVVLASNLTAGDHVVELYRETEGANGDTVFQGFVDGTLKAPPPAPGRLIEIIGDSISAGYGNLGSETHPPYTSQCTYSADTQSAYASYGAVAARALGADVSIIAHSGWGMYRDLNGNTSNVMPSIYGNTVGTEATPPWGFGPKADVVVINLGTNDSNSGAGANPDPGTPFETAYVAFLHTVRGHYPNAWIFLTIGPMTADPPLSAMQTHLTNVVATMADPKITTITMPMQDSSSTGCDFHPNVAEDQTMATLVVAAIRKQLPW